MSDSIYYISLFLIGYFLLISLIDITLLVISLITIARQSKSITPKNDENYLQDLSLTILVPAYNEEEKIVSCIDNIMKNRYLQCRIIVINDGSTDQTLTKINQRYSLEKVDGCFDNTITTKAIKSYYHSAKHKNLLIIDKINGGKADALNAGLNACRSDYYVSMDADTVYDEFALLKIIDRVSSAKNVVAASGNIRIVNSCKVDNGMIRRILFPHRILLGVQVAQYLRNIVFKRTGLSFLGSELIIAGAFGMYRRDIVLACGGYLSNCVGEDMELTIRVHRYCIEQKIEYNILLVADAVAWTQSPENIRDVITQGERWHRGMIDSLSRHRDMLLNPRYGKVAFIGFPYYFFTQLIAPILELSAWFFCAVGLYYNLIGWTVIAFLFIGTSGAVILLSVVSILFDKLIFNCYGTKEIIFKALPCSIIENFGFRQLIILSQLLSFIHYCRGNKSWKFTDSVSCRQP